MTHPIEPQSGPFYGPGGLSCANPWHARESYGQVGRCPECPPLATFQGSLPPKALLAEILRGLKAPQETSHGLVRTYVMGARITGAVATVDVQLPGGQSFRLTVEEIV